MLKIGSLTIPTNFIGLVLISNYKVLDAYKGVKRTVPLTPFKYYLYYGGIGLFRSSELTEEKRTGALFFSMHAILFMCFATYWPYLSIHFANRGIDAGRIGILSSLGSIATIFILPIWSRISDKTGNRRAVLKVITLGTSLAVLLFIFGSDFMSFFFISLCFFCFQVCLVPLVDAVVISYLANTKIQFSSIRIGGTFGFGIMILLSGHIYAYNSILTFVLSSILFFILFLCVSKIPQVTIEKTEKNKFEFRRVFHSKRIVFILLFAFAVQVAQGFFFAFFGIHVQDLGFTSREIGIAHFVGVLFEIPVFLVIDKVLRRFSTITVTLFCGFTVAVRMLMLYAATGMGMIYFSMILSGICFIGMYYSCATFINNEMSSDLKSTGQSMLAFFQMGLGSIVGNTLGGFITRQAGTHTTYLFFGIGLGVVCFLCTVVFFVISIRKRNDLIN